MFRKAIGSFIYGLFCFVAPLLLTPPSLAQDQTNAANIPAATTPNVWGEMAQVMGGVGGATSPDINGPKGIYAYVILESAIQRAAGEKGPIGTCTATPPANIDTLLFNYFSLLLQNPAVSGLAVDMQWCRLSKSDPATNPSDPDATYGWTYIDDIFKAVNTWNAAGLGPHKTIQLIVTPGFNAPDWLFIDMSNPESGGYLTSCDGLFLVPASSSVPPPSVPPTCGYTTVFRATEGGGSSARPLPLPWNSAYKTQWGKFLYALNQHIQTTEPNASDWVSIAVAGPTASSAETILPNGRDTNNPGTTLTVTSVPGVTTIPSGYTDRSANPSTPVSALDAWNILIFNGYGSNAVNYLDSDRPFIEEWVAAIDLFGSTFRGLTLVLVTGTGLPDFTASSNSPLLQPPSAFAPDCEKSSTSPGNDPMACAAATAILAYFAEPIAGGPNAKGTEQDALKGSGIHWTAISAASIKWHAQVTAAGAAGGMAVLPANQNSPGSQAVVSQILAGLQVEKPISQSKKNAEIVGCTDVGGCTSSSSFSNEKALLNALTAFFQGTAAGYYYSETTGTNGSATVENAPINYLQVYDRDILYVAGFDTCLELANMNELMKTPAAMATSLPCYGKPHKKMQKMLDTAREQILFSTAESPSVPTGCTCPFFVPRNAFPGDTVCTTKAGAQQAQNDSKASSYLAHYAANYINYALPMTSQVPYGTCAPNYYWRQAHMGDYVCVPRSHLEQIEGDNALFETRNETCPHRGSLGGPHPQ